MPKEPRSGHEIVGGIGWLARMIDKARLAAEGTIDELDLEYPCPLDRRLLGQLGIDAQTFQQIAVATSSDDAVLAALKAAGASL